VKKDRKMGEGKGGGEKANEEGRRQSKMREGKGRWEKATKDERRPKKLKDEQGGDVMRSGKMHLVWQGGGSWGGALPDCPDCPDLGKSFFFSPTSKLDFFSSFPYALLALLGI
jgi:hypothetical protein